MSQSMAEAFAAAAHELVSDKPRKQRKTRVTSPKVVSLKEIRPRRETIQQYHKRIDREIDVLLNYLTGR